MLQKNSKVCIHHWIIDDNNQGICKFCHSHKDFGKLLKANFNNKQNGYLRIEYQYGGK